jgi:hypothetical protein
MMRHSVDCPIINLSSTAASLLASVADNLTAGSRLSINYCKINQAVEKVMAEITGYWTRKERGF